MREATACGREGDEGGHASQDTSQTSAGRCWSGWIWHARIARKSTVYTGPGSPGKPRIHPNHTRSGPREAQIPSPLSPSHPPREAQNRHLLPPRGQPGPRAASGRESGRKRARTGPKRCPEHARFLHPAKTPVSLLVEKVASWTPESGKAGQKVA